ncbi:MAG: 3-dehydroquinate synthase [Lachnospiraceae bacterium]
MSIFVKESYEDLPDILKKKGVFGRRAMLVGDSNTLPLFGEDVTKALSACFSQVETYAFPAGEAYKNLTSIEGLYHALLAAGFDRKDMIFALGGGVVGDMAGFTAATYMRGITFVQLPTTLLSQVDSSIGGKTGIDFEGYKNMIGAFHMPACVYAVPKTLETLSKREFASGMGEVIKTALLGDESFFEWLLENMYEIDEREPKTIREMVRKAASIKERIVSEDPKEKGLRRILNLGHTLGHAIEKYKSFELPHGHCVALGCIAAAKISHSRELLSTEELFEIRDVFVAFGLPILLDGLDKEAVVALTKADKKMQAGQIRFVLLKKIGKAVVQTNVTDEELLDALAFISAEDMLKER